MWRPGGPFCVHMCKWACVQTCVCMHQTMILCILLHVGTNTWLSAVCLERLPVVAKQLGISFFPHIIIVYRPQLGVSMHYLQIV